MIDGKDAFAAPPASLTELGARTVAIVVDEVYASAGSQAVPEMLNGLGMAFAAALAMYSRKGHAGDCLRFLARAVDAAERDVPSAVN